MNGPQPPDRGPAEQQARRLLARAQRLERQGDLAGALTAYQEALRATQPGSGLAEELALIVQNLARQVQAGEGLEETAQQAAALQRAGRWQEAAAVYEWLLREKAAPAQQRFWRAALNHCQEEVRLAEAYGQAETAVAEHRWGAAAELLDEVLQQRPGYRARNQDAVALRAQVQHHLRKEARRTGQARPRALGRTFLWVVLALLGAAALALVGIEGYGWWQEQAQGQAALEATAAAAPWATVTAQAAGTTIALAGERATTTAVVAWERATQTSQAEQTQQALGAAWAAVTAQAGATATALAIRDATATSQAEATASAVAAEHARETASALGTEQAQAAETAQALETMSALARSATGTAEAQQTATARSEASAAAKTATAVALSRQRPGLIADFETNLTWRPGDQPYGELDRSTERVKAGSYAGRLRYDFPAVGDNYVVLQARPAISIGGRPTGIQAWVYGDGSGHFLNAWVQDAASEVRAYTFGRVQHYGWQLMTTWFDDQRGWPNGHISGSDNGQLDLPVRLYALVLDGVPDGQSSNGVIYLDEITATDQPISAAIPSSDRASSAPQNPIETTAATW
jgi:hypothetical protein